MGGSVRRRSPDEQRRPDDLAAITHASLEHGRRGISDIQSVAPAPTYANSSRMLVLPISGKLVGRDQIGQAMGRLLKVAGALVSVLVLAAGALVGVSVTHSRGRD